MLRPNIDDVGSQRAHIGVTNQVLTVLALRYTRVGREPHEVLPGGPLDVRGDIGGRTHTLLLNALVTIRGGIDDYIVGVDRFWQAEAKISDAVSGTL